VKSNERLNVSPINVIIAGLGGQGVLKASDILADAAFLAGHEVKKSELHGMSQRGGSVWSDVRYGREVFSPMIPDGESDFLVVLTPDQVEPHRTQLKSGGKLMVPELLEGINLPNRKSLNVALLGYLSAHLSIPADCWVQALQRNLPTEHFSANKSAFDLGASQAPIPANV
jgi:indolepyruvate ferredoxin oxidoreductase beta subunit